jgi:hypothetical protein
MTKREVRLQLLADLELPERGVLWDIGAGVGSVGLEALRLRPDYFNARLQLGVAIESLGQRPEAMNIYESRVQMPPDSGEAGQRRALLLLGLVLKGRGADGAAHDERGQRAGGRGGGGGRGGAGGKKKERGLCPSLSCQPLPSYS